MKALAIAALAIVAYYLYSQSQTGTVAGSAAAAVPQQNIAATVQVGSATIATPNVLVPIQIANIGTVPNTTTPLPSPPIISKSANDATGNNLAGFLDVNSTMRQII
jgi:hypothetical protein